MKIDKKIIINGLIIISFFYLVIGLASAITGSTTLYLSNIDDSKAILPTMDYMIYIVNLLLATSIIIGIAVINTLLNFFGIIKIKLVSVIVYALTFIGVLILTCISQNNMPYFNSKDSVNPADYALYTEFLSTTIQSLICIVIIGTCTFFAKESYDIKE